MQMAHGPIEYRVSNIVKLVVLINDKQWLGFCEIAHDSDAQRTSDKICERLSSVLPRFAFEIDIKVLLLGKVISRHKVKPHKHDPTQKCYGGDITRKIKLLSKQSQKLKGMKRTSEIHLPREIYCRYMSSIEID
ncbi:Elongation factor 4 [Thelohanellus kitauei]|uniref:Elongation factor 4 n=1 Tax=Thelohanellus kitauei TaxID=669202 RepID=A0A0C2N2K7_THEKT|nr:Elongation factor 4 [Thelohanellus kitauei]